MHAKNKTGLKTLNKLASDPRVEDIYDDGDGIWLNLVHGYVTCDNVTSLRADSAAAMLIEFRDARIEAGHTGHCC